MANLNKVMLIGRLTRDPKPINNGDGVRFGLAVNNRRRNKQTNQWEDDPVFVECEAWNRKDGRKLADVVSKLKKGQEHYIEGHLKMDEWEDKETGQRKTALRIVLNDVEFLTARDRSGEGEGGGDGYQRRDRRDGTGHGEPDESIPF